MPTISAAEQYGGYPHPAWELQPCYDIPIIRREALEEYLARHRPAVVNIDRLG